MFIIIVFLLGCDRQSGLLFFSCLLCFFSILTPLFLPPLSVSLSHFILAVPMRKCLGKHLLMSSPFPVAILNGTFFFRSVKAMNNWKRSSIKQILLLLLPPPPPSPLLLVVVHLYIFAYIWVCFIEIRMCNVYLTHTCVKGMDHQKNPLLFIWEKNVLNIK